jgi:hypothetical protein
MFVLGIHIAIKFGNAVLSSVIVLSDMIIRVFLVALKTDRYNSVADLSCNMHITNAAT